MLPVWSKNMSNGHFILCQSSSFIWTNYIATTWNNQLILVRQGLPRIKWVANKNKSIQDMQISRNAAAVLGKKKKRWDIINTGNFQLFVNGCAKFFTSLFGKLKKLIKSPNWQVVPSGSIHYLLNFTLMHLKLYS